MQASAKKAKMILGASYLILLVLILNSAFLSYKYWNFYFGGGMLDAFNCTDGCDSVMMSRYALIYGIPVPFYGLTVFVLITVCFILLNLMNSHTTPTYKFKSILQLLLDALVLSSCFAAMIFIYIMYLVLHMVCKFCLLSHIGTLLFALIYFFYIRLLYRHPE